MGVRIRFRRTTAAQWQAANPVLGQGEPGYDITNKKLKIGDGVTPWVNLPYSEKGIQSLFTGTAAPAANAGTDGDYYYRNTTGGVTFYQKINGSWSDKGFVSFQKSFIGSSDTPAGYTGHKGRAVVVNQAENGLEFVDFPDTGIGSDDIGQGLVLNSSNKLTLDLESKSLVSPSISPTWTLYKFDGSTAYNFDGDNITNSKNITVDKGVKATLNATFQYPAPNSSQAAPTSCSGNFGSTLPAAGVASAPLVESNISSNVSRSVTLIKPKSGLIVSNSQVNFASGNDSTGDSVSITFQGRGVLAKFNTASLTAAQIESVYNGSLGSAGTQNYLGAALQGGRGRTFTGVTTGSDEYIYYLLDSAFGQPTNVIQNDAQPVFTAFQFLANVVITNAAGFGTTIIVMRSNALGAAPDPIKLAFS